MDEIREETDKILEKIEDDIGKIYDDNVDEMEEMLEEYLSEFDDSDIKEEDYIAWLMSIVLAKPFKKLINELSYKYERINEYVMKYINNKMVDVYEVANDGDYDKKKLPKKKVNKKKDIYWNRKVIESRIWRAVIIGTSILDIPKIIYGVNESIKKSSIRQARTICNRYENLGRYDSYKKRGIKYKKWITMNDERVRASHSDIDGEVVPIDDLFSNGLLYPCDPSGSPEETYNCRCILGYEEED